MRSDLDDCHDQLTFCILLQGSLYVLPNIIQPTAGQHRFTAERVLRTRPKTYRAVVRLLAEPDPSIEHIAQQPSVSTHTVRAIRTRCCRDSRAKKAVGIHPR